MVAAGNAVRKVDATSFVNTRSRTSAIILRLPVRSLPLPRQAVVFGSFLIFLQALDAVFTLMGIHRFGTVIEGNPVIRYCMEEYGQIAALAAVKAVAIVLILSLVFLAGRMSWIKNAIGVVSFIYFFAAVLPWTYVLFLSPLAL